MTDSKFRLEAALKQSKTRKRHINFNNALPAEDHVGQHFRSVNEMCRKWGIEPATYRYRLKLGLTKKEALTLATVYGRCKKLK